jgi:hypothetical protein
VKMGKPRSSFVSPRPRRAARGRRKRATNSSWRGESEGEHDNQLRIRTSGNADSASFNTHGSTGRISHLAGASVS